ncbi:MAG: hypothetical protein SNJ71_08445, partial [Bacteroidales bacterium]
NVNIYPRGRQFTVKKNRNFDFDGIIEAGLFTFYGQDFAFNYEQFKIDMQNIDSMKIKVESFEKDEYGMRNLVDIQNVVENITGDLLIDDPNNKSSIKHFPQYPIFNSKNPSFVYYDYPSTQGGVYDRTRFYFAVDPYTVDSLNSFTTQGLSFDGEFVSADILPTFREKLMVQKDYSLGFTRVSPQNGWPIYKETATFYDTVNLSNKGLIGKGKIEYLNTQAYSDAFIFMPDSMNAVAKEYSITKQTKAQGTEYPQVDAKNVDVHWEPYNDKWVIKQKDKAIVMYDSLATLQGGTVFSSKGLRGFGTFTFGNAQLTSQTYTFKEHEVLADTSNFNLLTENTKLNDFAFKTQNISSYIDFEKKKAIFRSNDKMTVVQFPKNKYICYLNQFLWDMEKEEMELGASVQSEKDLADINFIGSRFFSVHPKQDTLNFVASHANYDLKTYLLNTHNVKYINVADAIIYPSDGEVIIEQDAKMRTLKDVKIIADNKNKYHTIYDATVDIKGRLDYTGSGKYDYTDIERKKQTLLLNLIKVDSIYQTQAFAKVTTADNFTLSPEFKYQGEINLQASQQNLFFKGYTMFENQCDMMNSYWISFQEQINPYNIMIPVPEQTEDIEGNELYSAIYLTLDSSHIYSTFLTKRKNHDDIPILQTRGYLRYDSPRKTFEIASKEKLEDKSKSGNYLSFHKEFCQVYGEGILNLGMQLGQVELKTYGLINHSLPSDRITLETFMMINFFFDNSKLSLMADTINSNTSLTPTNLNRKAYFKSLQELIGEEKTKQIASEIQLYGTMRRIPKELQYTLVFNQLDLQWNSYTRSYKSIGKIGVSNILDKQINKMLNGYVELTKRKGGDVLNIYLEVSQSVWFYFNYTNELMQTGA